MQPFSGGKNVVVPELDKSGILPLEFITVTDQAVANKSNVASRRLVRAQARKSAHRNKGTYAQAHATGSGGTKMKFKLSSWKRRNSNTTMEKQSFGFAFVISDRQDYNSSEDCNIPSASARLTVDLGPINVLPVPLIPMTKELLHFYHNGLRTNSFALNPDGDWYDITRVDAATLHAFLSTIAVLRQLQLGLTNSVAVLHHRCAAIQHMNGRLSDPVQRLSDYLIAAVAVLVNAEAMESSFELASLHMRGLVSMIQLRGGLENFNHLQTLQRVITWADFCFSSTCSLPPWFPLLDSLSQPLVPFDRQHRVRHVQPVMGKRFLNICEPPESLLTLLNMLRSISQSISLFPTIGSDRVAISNSIYVVEYKLLSIQHLHLGRQHAKNQIDISECVSLAALLYLHLAVRELPLKAHRHKQLKERLFHSLPHDQNLSSAVGSETDLTLLLWALFIGMDTTTRQEPQESLIKRMSELSTILCLEKYEDFISALKTVLWMDQFCEPRAIHLWDEITLRTCETM